ncbi:MAG: peptide chain release factor N(5)-glutamine methyltransferase [Chloroflexi bacterium]|nr:peptide chain release factor N(5)-glutamine methyltransferase [Chloroflexota bacterium]
MRQTLAHSQEALVRAGVGEAFLEADLLVAEALGIHRTALYAAWEDPFPRNLQPRLQRLLHRRAAREPLAYILGQREFYGLGFKVGRSVLIPRPETETLVGEALQIAKRLSSPSPKGRGGQGERLSPLLIADVGTGSGAIAVSLAKNLPNAFLYATDTSLRTLAIAKSNAKTHAVEERLDFRVGSLLSPLPEPVDIIAANLPYLPTSRISALEPEVSRYEPRRALDGGPDGLGLVRRLLRQSPGYLKVGGAILLELDPEQMEAAEAFALGVYPQAKARRVKDLAGMERVLVIECAETFGGLHSPLDTPIASL